MTAAFHTLGRSGLRVSRLALGTMTFGQPGWGCDRAAAGELLDAYLDHGGNFVDTADIYAGGESEQIVGDLLRARGARDRVVLSTKYSLGASAGDPNAGGNGRKAMLRALEGSLRRLGTDHVDLYLVHAWDGITPVEEVMRSLDDLVRSGKVRYVGLSDVPAWYASRAQTLAQWRGYEPLCALQLEYSLIERGVEYEFPPLCEEVGASLMTWGPLANGLLSGKYAETARSEGRDELPEGRLRATVAHARPETDKRSPRTWGIVRELDEVAREIGASSAQVAVNWVANRPAVGSVVLGASRVEQLRDTLGALQLDLPAELRARLDVATTPPRAVPYGFLPWVQQRMAAGAVDKTTGYHARDLRRVTA
jgi:aryl-alcohol dehydrogenase-like predicted oxidoreductase